jgi:hypothetical protein
MPEYNVQLRGWHVLVGIALIAGFFGAKMYLRLRSVDDAMRDAIRQELLKEYSGQGPKDVARLVQEAREGAPVEPIQPVVQRDVEFTSIGARGKMGALYTLVKVEITVDGGPPPDGRAVRYFRVERKFMGGGWLVVGDSDAYQYLTELMP